MNNTTGELVLTRDFDGKPVRQRTADGYFDATAMCKAVGKKWSHYTANAGTREFIQRLAESTGIPADRLVEQVSGRSGGTWIHPRVSMHFSQWASSAFAVAVSGWVLELLTTGRVELPNQPTAIGPTSDDIRKLIREEMATYALSVRNPVNEMPTVSDRCKQLGFGDLPKGSKDAIRTRTLRRSLLCDDRPQKFGHDRGEWHFYGASLTVLDDEIRKQADLIYRREKASGPTLFAPPQSEPRKTADGSV